MKNKSVLFISLHLCIFLLFGFFCLKNGFHISADLFSMIPETSENPAIKLADKKLTGNSSRNFFILSEHKNFDAAKANAQKAYNSLLNSQNYEAYFESISLYNGTQDYEEIQSFLQNYRWNFLSEETQNQLKTEEGIEDFVENALSQVFNGFTILNLDNLEQDPFLFDEQNVRAFLRILQDSGTNLSPKDGVLATQFEDNWYVLIQGVFTDKGAALATKNNGIQEIYKICLPMEDEDCRFLFSGTPFHSHKSSTSANREISIISTVSLLAVLIMLIFVFRSPLPILASFASVLVSVTTAICVTHLIFGQLHALTLVFGTSLIGSCIDYSLHYFINWKANQKLKNGIEIKNFLLKGLFLSLVSTELCYLLLVFAPFPLLKQIAVFSFSGIFCSFLAVVWLFPAFKIEKESRRKLPEISKYFSEKANPPSPKLYFLRLIAIFVLPAAIILLNFNHLKIHNNLSALYKMEGRLKDDTILSAKVLNYTPSSWFIIQGNSQQELLQNEELFSKEFEKAFPQNSRNFLCTSRIIPSIKKQKASILVAKQVLNLAPAQFDALGFDDIPLLCSNIDKTFKKSEANFVTPENNLPSQLKNIKEILWIGQIENKYYSVFMPTVNLDQKICKQLALENQNVSFQNKVQQISEGLNKLSKMILICFAIAYFIIIFTLRFFFSAKQTLKIALVPALSVLYITAVFIITKTPLDFFCITGMILVFGLGIDYIIYMTHHNGGKLERIAVLLSFLTTAISFGTLALSNFVPVHSIGLAIFSGLIAAFFATIWL